MTAGRRVLAACAIAAIAAAPGCGYRLAGGNTFLPDRIRSILVRPFDNRTQRPEIDQRVTEAVAREMSRRGGYRLAVRREEADAVLEGVVTDYRTNPVQFDAEGRATRMEAVVVLQATLRERANDAVLWSQTGLVFREQYDVREEALEEAIALEDIAKGAAGALVTSMFEGF